MEPYNNNFCAKILVDAPREDALFREMQAVASGLESLFGKQFALFKDSPERFTERDRLSAFFFSQENTFSGAGLPRIETLSLQESETTNFDEDWLLFCVCADGLRQATLKMLRSRAANAKTLYVSRVFFREERDVGPNEMHVSVDPSAGGEPGLLVNDIMSVFLFPSLVSMDVADLCFTRYSRFLSVSFESISHFRRERTLLRKTIGPAPKSCLAIVNYPQNTGFTDRLDCYDFINELAGEFFGIETLLIVDNTVNPIHDGLRVSLLLSKR